MTIRTVWAAFCCFFIMAGAASATTISYTEGRRATVDGSIDITPADVVSAPPGFALGDVGFDAGDNSAIEVYGRIVGAVDTYNFSASSNFIIEFIFEGYLVDGNLITPSGFVNDNSNGSTTEFSLIDAATNMIVASSLLSTDITGGNALIFAAGAGDYILSLNGMSAAALYDIRIRAVPIPAALPLFLSALAGLGFASRRRNKA